MSPPISGTGISVVTDRTWSLHVFYQLLDGHVQQSKHVDGVWSEDPLPFSPVAHSPLASITYGSGREVSMPPHISGGAQPHERVVRSVYTTLTVTPWSKSTAIPLDEAGILERSAICTPRLTPALASPPSRTAKRRLVKVKTVFTFAFTINVSITSLRTQHIC